LADIEMDHQGVTEKQYQHSVHNVSRPYYSNSKIMSSHLSRH